MFPYIVTDPSGEAIATLLRPLDVAYMLACYGQGTTVQRASDGATLWAPNEEVDADPEAYDVAAAEIARRHGGAQARTH